MSTNKREKTITIIPAKKDPLTAEEDHPKTRVAAYCRVSTAHDNQINSYQTQITYYTDLIASNPDWELVGIFADEGLSGTQLLHRAEMNRMLAKCHEGKIDLILCKSISRFARNTVDLLDIVRDLKTLGIGVRFEKENIDTLNVDSEFIISLYASFAQAESESISQNILWGIRKKFAEGKVMYNMHNTLGYRMGEDGIPVIVEEEAEIVRRIFASFADGASMKEIAKELTDEKVPRRDGATVWNRGNVFSILKSEKYVGDAISQKSYTVDCLSHRRAENHGQRPKYYIQNAHEPIIDRETWDRVRLELARRSLKAGRHHPEKGSYRTKYLLNDLLFCPLCGANYKRTIWQISGRSVGVWRCGTRMELNSKKCPDSPSIHEDKLHRALIRAANEILSDPGELLRQASAERDRLSKVITTTKESETDNLRLKICEDAALLDYFNSEEEIRPLTHFDDRMIRRLMERIEVTGKHEIRIIFRGGLEEKVEVE